MKTIQAAILAAAFMIASAASAFALNPLHGMPREPISKAGKCAKASQGVHIPYRGWRTRNRLLFMTCMWY